MDKKVIDNLIENLKKNNIEGIYISSKKEISKYLDEYIKSGWTIGMGGSMTLVETGTIEYIRKREDVSFLDRNREGISKEEVNRIRYESLSSDLFLTSVNALTQNGELILVDGTGSRVSAVCFGPKKVLVVTGTNKIVSNIGEGFKRIRELAGPKNCKRLNWKTMCLDTGVCDETNCHPPNTICNEYVVIRGQVDKERMQVLIIDGNFGY